MAREDRGYNKTDQKSNNLIILKRMLQSYHFGHTQELSWFTDSEKLPFTVYWTVSKENTIDSW